MSQKTIDLADFRPPAGKVFTGRDYGQQLRERLALDALDDQDELTVRVVVPSDTLSLNSSFFLGLFGPSVRSLGREDFQKQYEFECAERIRHNINTGIRRALLSTNAIEEFGEE